MTDRAQRDEIISMMARTLFVTAYADRETERGRSIGGGRDWFDAAPARTPAKARYAALSLALAIEKANRASLDRIYRHAARMKGTHYRKPTLRDFGYGITMQALGHGVSWFDDHPRFPLTIPHVEFDWRTLWAR